MSNSKSAAGEKFWTGFWPSMAVLAVILAFLFRDSFKPGIAHFSNDGPLGVAASEALRLPGAFSGYWVDANWVGSNGAAAPASVTYLFLWLLGPVGYSKFYPPIALWLLGVGAWIFFRTLKLSPGLCLVAAIAAALNMNFFSNTCWGLGTRATTLMSAFLALAALNTRRAGNPWLNAVLAGLATGLGVVEGADNGAIFSLFIAAFVLFQSFAEETTWPRRLVSCLRLGIVGFCAAFLAAQVLVTLVGIAVKTAPGAQSATAATAPMTPEQKEEERQQKWVFATQWSLSPKELALRLIIPGIHGYRMDTEGGGQYWGRVGEYFAMPDGPERRSSRSSGAGEYAGVLVVIGGLWALLHAARAGGPKPIFEARERKYILFWAAMFIPAMIFSWGYHAPFYKLVYALPYFSTIRNPMKFMHPGHMILMILFAYGLLGLSRRYLETALVNASSFGERFRNWSAKAMPVEKWWFRLSLVFAAVGIISWLGFANARAGLVRHLQEIGFPDETYAASIAKFATGEVGMFALFLLASLALVAMIQLGAFSGPRAKVAVILLATLLTIDLARSNLPWIKHYDYRAQYAPNPVTDFLRKDPWLHRTAVFPMGLIQQPQAAQQIAIANNVAGRGPWLQWNYAYYNIQSLDIPQDPRRSPDKTNYLAHVSRSGSRLWELTNVRYVLGLAGQFSEAVNQTMDPVRRSFREVLPFRFTQDDKNNIGAVTDPNGPWALVEFGGALPRAKLYTDWLTNAADDTTLNMLGNPSFDPHKLVAVHDPIPAPGNTNATPGTVEFSSYSSRRIELKVNATAPSVLLHNDKYDPAWTVTVNGKPEKLLRANYLMRAVQVPAGASNVVLHFRPSLTGMKISLAGFALGIGLCVFLFIQARRSPASTA